MMGRKMGNPNELKVVNVRLVREPSLYSTEKIASPEDAVKVIAKDLATYDREVFAVLNLKTNGQPINFNICSIGSLDSAMVSPRESEVTKRLMEACDVIGVRFLDHVIVGSGNSGIYSFRAEGELDRLRPSHREWER